MNKVILVGNMTKDPDERTTSGGVAVTTFTIAVQRKYKDGNGNYQADFINCVAWRSTAEFIAKYFTKGSKIGVVGSIQTRTYEDANNVKKYITEVVVDEAEFVTSKAQTGGSGRQPPPPGQDQLEDEDFIPLDDAELPF